MASNVQHRTNTVRIKEIPVGNTDPLTLNFGIRFAGVELDDPTTEYDGGRDYYDTAAGFGLTWWPADWVGLEGSLLFNHTSSNEHTIGSRRALATIELSPKFRLPFALVDHLYISPYASVSTGASWLNFGGGDNPTFAFEAVADFGGLGGAMFALTDDLGLEFYAGYSRGLSFTRNYAENSIFGGLKFTYGPQAEYQSF